jgi:hypothetical protein
MDGKEQKHDGEHLKDLEYEGFRAWRRRISNALVAYAAVLKVKTRNGSAAHRGVR